MAGRIFAVAGLCGVGKTTAVNYLAKAADGEVIYFGSTVLRVVRERGLAETSENEQIIRIALRKEHGDACLAMIEADRMKAILNCGRDVFVDALYVDEEFQFLANLMEGVPLFLVGIEVSFAKRLERLEIRAVRPLKEPQLRERDAVEMKKLKTGDVFKKAFERLQNDGPIEKFESDLSRVLKAV